MEKKDFFHEVKEKHWPNAKAELEKGINSAKKMLLSGEKHLKQFSERGADKTRKIALQVKREKLVYKLGKFVATKPKNKWSSDKEIQQIRNEIKDLEKEIKKIK